MAHFRPDDDPPGSTGDLGTTFVLGFDFTADDSCTVTGVWWYQPATGVVTDLQARLYDNGQALLASGTMLAASVTRPAWNLVEFDTPYSAAAGDYTGAMRAGGEQGFDGSVSYPIDDASNTMHMTQGRYTNGGGTGFPETTWGGLHGLDLEFDLATAVTGTGAANLGALAATASGTRAVHGTVVASLGTLTAAASGKRSITALAAAALGPLNAASAGTRTVHGTAAAALGALTATAAVFAGTPATGFRQEATRTTFPRIGGGA